MNLIASDLSFSYGKDAIVQNISLNLEPGTLTALVGRNGSGKSTLLRLLQGQYPPDSGEIFVGGVPLGKCRERVALMPQRNSIQWHFPITVSELVSLGRIGGSQSGCCDLAAALQRVGLSELASKRLDALSGGQQQRTLLARTLMQSAQVFLLDEPCSALDPPSREAFLVLVRQLADAGYTFFVSSHDWGESLNVYDRVIVLDNIVLADGSPEDVRKELGAIPSMGNHCCG